MTKDEPKVGQVVYLNSGSPPLIVTNNHEPITVCWLNAQGYLQKAEFPAVCLTTERKTYGEE